MKVIFLDRDGTINLEPPDGIVDSFEKVKIFPFVIPALKLFSENYFKLILITNQHGINLGRLSEKEFRIINDTILKQLFDSNIAILDTFFCPHLTEEACNCHKPKTGLIDQACQKYPINLPESYIIGDRNTDIVLGKKVGCKTIFVKTGNHQTENTDPDYIAEDLLAAAEYIIKSKRSSKI